MSVSSVSVNASSLNFLTVVDGLPRLLHGLGPARQAADSVDFTANPSASSLTSASGRNSILQDLTNPAATSSLAMRELQALQAAFQASDLTGARRAFVALKQALPSDVSSGGNPSEGASPTTAISFSSSNFVQATASEPQPEG
jgi:hypothetical protein